jgi:hypothetical protein
MLDPCQEEIKWVLLKYCGMDVNEPANRVCFPNGVTASFNTFGATNFFENVTEVALQSPGDIWLVIQAHGTEVWGQRRAFEKMLKTLSWTRHHRVVFVGMFSCKSLLHEHGFLPDMIFSTCPDVVCVAGHKGEPYETGEQKDERFIEAMVDAPNPTAAANRYLTDPMGVDDVDGVISFCWGPGPGPGPGSGPGPGPGPGPIPSPSPSPTSVALSPADPGSALTDLTAANAVADTAGAAYEAPEVPHALMLQSPWADLVVTTDGPEFWLLMQTLCPVELIGKRVCVIKSSTTTKFRKYGCTKLETDTGQVLPAAPPDGQTLCGSVVLASTRPITVAELTANQALHCIQHLHKVTEKFIWVTTNPATITPFTVTGFDKCKRLATVKVKSAWVKLVSHGGLGALVTRTDVKSLTVCLQAPPLSAPSSETISFPTLGKSAVRITGCLQRCVVHAIEATGVHKSQWTTDERLTALFFLAIVARSSKNMPTHNPAIKIAFAPQVLQNRVALMMTKWIGAHEADFDASDNARFASILSLLGQPAGGGKGTLPTLVVDPETIITEYEEVTLHNFAEKHSNEFSSDMSSDTRLSIVADIHRFLADSYDIWMRCIVHKWDTVCEEDLVGSADRIPSLMLDWVLHANQSWVWAEQWLDFSPSTDQLFVRPLFRVIAFLALHITIFYTVFALVDRKFPGIRWVRLFQHLNAKHKYLCEKGMYALDPEVMTAMGTVLRCMHAALPGLACELHADFLAWELCTMSGIIHDDSAQPHLKTKNWVPNLTFPRCLPMASHHEMRVHAIHQYFLVAWKMLIYIRLNCKSITHAPRDANNEKDAPPVAVPTYPVILDTPPPPAYRRKVDERLILMPKWYGSKAPGPFPVPYVTHWLLFAKELTDLRLTRATP